jgi:pimeloyl-ACP methyl ester carboxylesterase
MKNLLLSLLALSSPLASAETGFLRLPAGHSVFVEYDRASNGKDTFVLVNGLVYDLNRWDSLAAELRKQGHGVLRYYFRGQLGTLRKEAEDTGGKPKFFRSGLSREDFALELREIMDSLRIKEAHIVGLSFGAGIAAEFGERFPDRVDQLMFLAPLVVSLDRYDPSGAWIHWNLDALRLFWGPLWGPYVYDYYYNMIFRSYLEKRLVPERIPAEMADMPEIYKESIFHQVRSMRDFDLREAKFGKLKGRVHMVLASEEEEAALKDQFKAWSAWGSAQGSLVYLTPSYHAIPDAVGAYGGRVLLRLVNEKAPSVYFSELSRDVDGWKKMASEKELERAVAADRKK